MDLEKCLLALLFLVIALIYRVDGRIKVLTTLDDDTVYTVRERPIIMNIDSPSKGLLIVSTPVNACQPILPPPFTPSNESTNISRNASDVKTKNQKGDQFAWILLVSWSPNDDDCSIRVKAEHAATAGYTVILFQDPSDPDNEAEPLTPLLAPLTPSTSSIQYGWTDASVYACTINPEDWDVLSKNFTTADYYLSFDDSNSMSGWFTYFIVGILVIGAVFFTIGLSYVLVQLLVLILIWIRESIVSRIQQMRRDRRRRLPASQLKKIPIQQWNSDMLQDMCSICLESFTTADRVRILPCSHVFHQNCIDVWLLKERRKCPNCKRKIVFPDENRDSDSSSDDERTPLLRRGSSVRESSSSSNVSPRSIRPYLPQRRTEQNSGQPSRTVEDTSSVRSERGHGHIVGSSRAVQQNQASSPSPMHSSINTSSDALETNESSTAAQEIKGKVDQLCARMESVGRKIKKKVKTSQASKQDIDSSSDLSTTVEPVLVTVTVESNHVPDTSNEYSEPHQEESQSREQEPSSVNCGTEVAKGCAISNATSNPDQTMPADSTKDLEVKVVPDCPSASPSHSYGNSRNTAEETNHCEPREKSILPDLNA